MGLLAFAPQHLNALGHRGARPVGDARVGDVALSDLLWSVGLSLCGGYRDQPVEVGRRLGSLRLLPDFDSRPGIRQCSLKCPRLFAVGRVRDLAGLVAFVKVVQFALGGADNGTRCLDFASQGVTQRIDVLVRSRHLSGQLRTLQLPLLYVAPFWGCLVVEFVYLPSDPVSGTQGLSEYRKCVYQGHLLSGGDLISPIVSDYTDFSRIPAARHTWLSWAGKTMLRHFALTGAVCAIVLQVLSPMPARADDGMRAAIEGLNDTENAYVAGVNAAYATARAALDRLSSELGGAALGALLGGGMPEPTELLNMVLACRTGLAAAVPAFRDSPPESMQGVAGINSTIASRLEGAFSPALAIVVEEGKNRVLDAGRNFLGGLLGAPPAPEQSGTSFKARLASSVLAEIGDLEALLDSGQAALNEQVKAVQEAQAAGEDFLNMFFDECFIATAAYGTNTAVEIDVLRGFRDDVLMRSKEGRDLVGFYYAASPPLAEFIRNHEMLRTAVREAVIDPIVRGVTLSRPLWTPH